MHDKGAWHNADDIRKIIELELARDNYKNVLVGMEFENIDSLATESRDTTQIGRVAAQRIQQHVYRITELEKQLEEHGICEICKDKSVLVADKYKEQNAKMIKVLEKIANGKLPHHPIPCREVYVRNIAAAAIKEVRGEHGTD